MVWKKIRQTFSRANSERSQIDGMQARREEMGAFETVMLPSGPEEANPIQKILEAHNFPIRTSRWELEAEYGTYRHPGYDWEMIALRPCPFGWKGLITPIATMNGSQSADIAPPLYYTSEFWFSQDVFDNFERALAEVSPLLGQARPGAYLNTVKGEWRAGPARISLTGFPTDWQTYPGGNPSHERDPRLRTTCHLAIETGYRAPLTPQERAWIDGCVEIVPVSERNASSLRELWENPSHDYLWTFIREPVSGCEPLFGKAGLSADGQALIVCTHQLIVIPMARVIDVNVYGLLPAKGAGGAWLELRVARGGDQFVSITISESGKAGDLDDLARHFSAAIERPVVFHKATYDA